VLLLTYCDVLSQLLHTLLEYKIQHATYLLSCELLSRLLRPMYTYCYISINHSNCIRTLGCNPSNQYTTFSYTCWQVGFVLRSAPPVTLCPPVLPSREHKQTFFPTHLLYSYNHRSYQWSHPHGCKQACIDEPLLAQSCRTILLWAYHYAYSKEAMPPNSYTNTHSQESNLPTSLYTGRCYIHYISVYGAFMCMCIRTIQNGASNWTRTSNLTIMSRVL
jgi:hypothetical protein